MKTQRDCLVSTVISPNAYNLGDWLIMTYQVQPGYGLAKYLGVCSSYCNQSAVRMWVHIQEQTWPTEMRTTGILKAAFVRLLPNEYFQ